MASMKSTASGAQTSHAEKYANTYVYVARRYDRAETYATEMKIVSVSIVSVRVVRRRARIRSPSYGPRNFRNSELPSRGKFIEA